MNKHLKLVNEFHDTLPFPKAKHGANGHLSDMDIVMYQALLMEEGSVVLAAFKTGEMVEILVGLVNLAYYAVSAIAMREGDVLEHPVTWRHDGSVLSIMRALSEKINNCSSGSIDGYSDVYCLCVHLTRSFINADFDKAFSMIHKANMSKFVESIEHTNEDIEKARKIKLSKSPDLSDCLYE
jgi:hypothetical protein